ncbi:hypothetical protein UFOVP53_70 [uncultured Caudovirales phage]|uniref:Uncharacterized protein n=1 Tax=uncultured Caudovirales phage TaxID=2100421 RepID=A0A6J5KVE9_9CAUD|nr:hypothetical protein UFOVP53_70 [uncultured Caudovirales phage]
MKNIKIGFSCSSSWKIGSAALKWYMDTEYSHAYIRYQDSQDRDVVFQAAHGTVHPILFENFIKENKVTHEFEIEFSHEEYQKLRNFYYSEMGKPYAYKDLFIILAYDTCKKIGIKVQDGNIPGYICSQLAATVLSEIKGYKFDKPLNLVRPNDLFKKLE